MAAPTEITRSYVAAGVAPHAPTQRWTYTVPAGRFFELSHAFAEAIRDAAAGAAAIVSAYIDYTPSGGATARILNPIYVGLALDTRAGFVLPGGLKAAAGAIFTGNTFDAAAAGTNLYVLTLSGVEYDT